MLSYKQNTCKKATNTPQLSPRGKIYYRLFRNLWLWLKLPSGMMLYCGVRSFMQDLILLDDLRREELKKRQHLNSLEFIRGLTMLLHSRPIYKPKANRP